MKTRHYTIIFWLHGRCHPFAIDVRSEAQLEDILGRLQTSLGVNNPITYREAGSSETVRFVPMRLIRTYGGFREANAAVGPLL